MKQLRLRIAAAAMALACAVGVAGADVTISTSNNPGAELGTELMQLMNTDRIALNSATTGDFNRLTRAPMTRRSARDFYSRDYLAKLPKAEGGKEWYCLAEAIYFEARGEDVIGQFAVAEVILNRVDSHRFPATICKVVNQGTGQKHRCQFSYTCDGKAETISEARAWARAGKIARIMLDGGPRVLTGGATFYHTKAVSPKWSKAFHQTTTIGTHRFYIPEAPAPATS